MGSVTLQKVFLSCAKYIFLKAVLLILVILVDFIDRRFDVTAGFQ